MRVSEYQNGISLRYILRFSRDLLDFGHDDVLRHSEERVCNFDSDDNGTNRINDVIRGNRNVFGSENIAWGFRRILLVLLDLHFEVSVFEHRVLSNRKNKKPRSSPKGGLNGG